MKKNLITLWLITIIIIEIFVLLPTSIYLGNSQEFLTPLITIILMYKTPAIGCFLILLLISIFLKGKAFERYLVFMSIISILLWLQGFVLIWDYGILNGTPIIWNSFDWRGILDLSIWVICITLSMIFYSKIKSQLIQLASILFLAQLLLLTYSIVTQIGKVNKKEYIINHQKTLENIHNFSSEYNVLHLMLDGFQSDVFQDLMIMDEIGTDYQKDLQGFVFFDETMSAFPYTRFSIPSFISGKIYKNKVSKDSFNSSVFAGKNIFNTAFSKGLEVDFVADEFFTPFHLKSKHNNMHVLSNDSSGDFTLSNSSKLIDLTLFRMTPHLLKKYIYNDQEWLISSMVMLNRKSQHKYFSHTDFMENLTHNLKVDRKSPVYKYIHVMMTHNPMVVNKDCTYVGSTLLTSRGSITNQSKCSLDTVIKLFDQMKKLNVYDNTLIVMHADHGSWAEPYRFDPQTINKYLKKSIPQQASALSLPLLAIKPINAKDKFKNSSVLTSLVDIPDTISSLMNWDVEFNSQSVFDIDITKTRERRFYYYYWQQDAWTSEYTGPISEYIVKGSHNVTPWILNDTFNPPNIKTKK
jgi:hypothetical protein